MTVLKCQPSVEILLAAFNAEDYLPRQIESILNQSYSNFRLIILDDHSTDRTQDLIALYQAADSRITFVVPLRPFRQPLRSFEYLLSLSTAEFVFLSDHDDVWLPEKLSEQMKLIDQLTNSPGPLLVSSNAYLVSGEVAQSAGYRGYPCFFSASFVAWFNDLTVRDKASYLSHSNLVIGHTIGLNRALIEMSLPFPETVRMHDWWLATLAALGGMIFVDKKAMTFYRQHRKNYIGSSRWRRFKAFDFGAFKFVLTRLLQSLAQFNSALSRVSKSQGLRPSEHGLKSFIMTIPSLSRWQLFVGFLKFGLFAPVGDLPKLLAQLLLIFRHKPSRSKRQA